MARAARAPGARAGRRSRDARPRTPPVRRHHHQSRAGAARRRLARPAPAPAAVRSTRVLGAPPGAPVRRDAVAGIRPKHDGSLARRHRRRRRPLDPRGAAGPLAGRVEHAYDRPADDGRADPRRRLRSHGGVRGSLAGDRERAPRADGRAAGPAVGRAGADRRRAHGDSLRPWPARPRHDLGARAGARDPRRRVESRGGRPGAIPLPGRSVGAGRVRLRARVSLERRVPRPSAALARPALPRPDGRLRARDAPARRGGGRERAGRRGGRVRAGEALSGGPLAMTKNAARDWYKDAVFYEVHVKAYKDANGDGIGDFAGLTESLDYIQELGVDCLWILPMYPSPLRDDGYDISDFYAIHPSYGSVEDFQKFLDAAHARDLRVITDLVMNHTSDQHPWFQASRSDPTGPYADYYVWSGTNRRYADARVIFVDAGASNWTWDPRRNAYYWHRFFSHQPDLNYDNPAVRRRMLDVMRFWLDRGLDGFRCDAVPYLVEREGTSCENLPETHAVLKEFRAVIDREYGGDRVLLAEANQWPEDVRAYFGDGDEFHMAFHFPLMPRLYLALRLEERRPIVDIYTHTPPIPPACQWGLFLRNHDELTLEMVTNEERAFMYYAYAQDPEMKLNLGIRRRLAPLLDNDGRRIELLNSLLLTLPGSPIVYYGDEIGMGDNVYLGDRDGVRTPMQWSGDRNAGFSRADWAQLYLQPLMDPVYGYQAVNIEAQLRTPTSYLRWLHRFIALRKEHPVFGLGTYEPLASDNSRIFAHIRKWEEDIVLCVHNVARSAQAVQLDLSAFEGRFPIELHGRSRFPRIGELPYLLTLQPRGFFWFQLQAPEKEAEDDAGG